MSIKAVWNGEVIAESDETLVLEGNHYFPPDAIKKEYFEPNDQKSHCFWKGTASYYDIKVHGQQNPAAGWYYPNPSQAAAEIKDHVAFWKGVKIVNSNEA
jgi:uncharacterized protein (DUF427 family)